MATVQNLTGESSILEKLTDEELLELSVKKNYEAFEELVRRYESRVYGLGLKMLRSPHDAEDMLQKTFLSVFENMDKFRGESKVSSWIFRIATNHALMKLRKEKGKKVDSLDAPKEFGHESFENQLPDLDTDISRIYESKEFMGLLEQAISEMPEIYRLVFILRDIEGFSNKEVADMLNLGVPAIKSRVLRARLFLREKLGEMSERGGKE